MEIARRDDLRRLLRRCVVDVAMADLQGKSLQFEVGAPDSGLDPASDTALLREGFATLTPLTTVEPSPFPDGCPEFPRMEN